MHVNLPEQCKSSSYGVTYFRCEGFDYDVPPMAQACRVDHLMPPVQIATNFLGYAVAHEYCRDFHGRFWQARRGPAYRIAAWSGLINLIKWGLY
jgi:hypothetical protein